MKSSNQDLEQDEQAFDDDEQNDEDFDEREKEDFDRRDLNQNVEKEEPVSVATAPTHLEESKVHSDDEHKLHDDLGHTEKRNSEQEVEDKENILKKPKKIGPEPVKAGEVYAQTQNVVVSASIHRPLPLVRLSTQLEGAEYNPEQFPGLILKIQEPKASALLFSSGKVICTGTKSIAEAKRAIDAIIVKVEALGLKVTEKPDIEVTNIVASGSVGGRLNLNSIIFTFENTEYEPEQFPGLVYKMPETNVTFLLFGTGRVVITGAKSQKEIITTVHKLRDQLVEAGELEK